MSLLTKYIEGTVKRKVYTQEYTEMKNVFGLRSMIRTGPGVRFQGLTPGWYPDDIPPYTILTIELQDGDLGEFAICDRQKSIPLGGKVGVHVSRIKGYRPSERATRGEIETEDGGNEPFEIEQKRYPIVTRWEPLKLSVPQTQ